MIDVPVTHALMHLSKHRLIHSVDGLQFHVTNRGANIVDMLLVDRPDIKAQYDQLITYGCNIALARLSVLISATEVWLSLVASP